MFKVKILLSLHFTQGSAEISQDLLPQKAEQHQHTLITWPSCFEK